MKEFFASPGFYFACAGVVGAAGLWLLHCGLLGDRSRGKPRCPKCWYDLSGGAPREGVAIPAVVQVAACPECGKKITKPRQLYRTRRHLWTVALGLLLVSLALYSYEVRHRALRGGERLRTAVIPSTGYIVALPWLGKENFDIVKARFDNRLLLNSDKPQGAEFWGWQQWMYQRSLSALVTGDDVNLRADALLLLQAMAMTDDDALDLFISHLDHDDSAMRQRAMQWAESLDKRMLRGRDAVIARLEDENKTTRQAAVFVLERIGPQQCEGMSDEELCRVAGLLFSGKTGGGMEAQPREFYLKAMVKRGGPVVTKWLRERVASPPVSRWGDDVPENLALLTALRGGRRAR